MIASFFQSLETHRVAYLLISGQATVLYGAATFSEDIDAGNGTRSALTSPLPHGKMTPKEVSAVDSLPHNR